MFGTVLLFVFEGLNSVSGAKEWSYPWKYDTMLFEGPEYWGIHTHWAMCSKGKLQSPINIKPEKLLFDPHLKPIHLDRISVMSELVNTGQMPRVRIGNSMRRPSANLTGGPLNTYRFRVQRIDIHFGMRAHNNGSEHAIDGRKFPMELQMLAYNTDLYGNFSSAVHSPHGIAAVSVLVEFGPETNEELLKLTVATASIQYKNQRVELADLRPWQLLPYTRDFVTYEGSMTSPGCDETVTWIIMNQPIHISKDHYDEWAKLSQLSAENTEPLPMGPNCRALMEHNGRMVRTNIAHRPAQLHNNRLLRAKTAQKGSECELPKVTYRATTSLPQPVKIHLPRHKQRHPGRHAEEMEDLL